MKELAKLLNTLNKKDFTKSGKYFIEFHSMKDVWLFQNTEYEPTSIEAGTLDEIMDYMREVIKRYSGKRPYMGR